MMTSEVENIMNGVVVRKVAADKAIGVSTSNLMPNEKGEVPLSKQTNFQIVSPTMTQTPSLVTEELDLTPSSDKDLGEQESTLTQVTPTVPIINDIISDNPVDVVAPTQLDGLDIDSIIPNIPFVSDEDVKKETVEGTVEENNAELPSMPETILAEEPTGIDDNLFVNVQNMTTPVVPSDMPSTGNSPREVADASTLPFISEVREELTGEDIKQDLSSSASNVQETVDAPTIPTLESNGDLNKEAQEINPGLQTKSQDEKDTILGMILKNTEEIKADLNILREKIGLNADIKMQVPSLPQESTPVDTSTASLTAPLAEKQEEMVNALSQIGTTSEFSVDESPIKGGMFI